MLILAHISDLHFGREDPRLISALLQSIEKINPQLVVISGDLTQRARKREFLAARAFIETLARPHIVVAGNHDIPAYNLTERFLSPWRKWYRYLGYNLQPKTRTDDCIAVGINTVRRSGSFLDWSRGRVSDEQVRLMVGYFNKGDEDKMRVVVAHHPFWLPDEYSHRHLVGGRDRAFTSIKQAGGDIILSGHVHLAYTHLLEGVIISHAGTAISNRLTAGIRNSFKVVRGDRKMVGVETWKWNTASFAISELLSFTRIDGEWKVGSRRV
ncbi:MAG: metallophosphoesterase family protein [Desulforhopalus sp.]